MAKIAKSIRVEQALHNQVKSHGAGMGLGVEESYEKALMHWVNPETAPLASPEESEKIDLLLRVMRFAEPAIALGVVAMLDSQKDKLPALPKAKKRKTA